MLLSEAPYFAEELPENLAASVLEVAKEYDYFLFVANPAGKAAAPRVAAFLSGDHDVDVAADLLSSGDQRINRRVQSCLARQIIELENNLNIGLFLRNIT